MINVATIITAFVLGILSAFSPCVLPLLPLFIAYALKQREQQLLWRILSALAIVAGIMVSMLIVGLLLSMIGELASTLLEALSIIVGIILIVLGLVIIVKPKFMYKLASSSGIKITRTGILGAFEYGLLFGPLILPCSLPIVLAVFLTSFTVAQSIGRLLIFIIYGIGMGIPITLIVLLTSELRKAVISKYVKVSRKIDYISGAILIIFGIYLAVFHPI